MFCDGSSKHIAVQSNHWVILSEVSKLPVLSAHLKFREESKVYTSPLTPEDVRFGKLRRTAEFIHYSFEYYGAFPFIGQLSLPAPALYLLQTSVHQGKPAISQSSQLRLFQPPWTPAGLRQASHILEKSAVTAGKADQLTHAACIPPHSPVWCLFFPLPPSSLWFLA